MRQSIITIIDYQGVSMRPGRGTTQTSAGQHESLVWLRRSKHRVHNGYFGVILLNNSIERLEGEAQLPSALGRGIDAALAELDLKEDAQQDPRANNERLASKEASGQV